MNAIRPRLKELVDLLSEMNQAPEPPATFSKAIEAYTKVVKDAKRKRLEEEQWRDLLADLANTDESSAERKLNSLSETDFKTFCVVNRVKMAKGRVAKKIKGKVVQKAVAAKVAKKGKPAQPATPARYAPDSIVPAITVREATTESILEQARQLKSQATI